MQLHDEERLKVLMTLGRQRYTSGHGNPVLAVNEGQTVAVNVVLRSRSIELDEKVLRLWCWISSLADLGGFERRELGDGR